MPIVKLEELSPKEYQLAVKKAKLIKKQFGEQHRITKIVYYKSLGNLGLICVMRTRCCNRKLRYEWQCNPTDSPVWWRQISAPSRRHNRYCPLRNRPAEPFIEHFCGCGYPVEAYSPNCSDLCHTPALPDEATPESIVAYKKTRLLYLARYLKIRYGTEEWLEELFNEMLPQLELTHTYQFNLPIPAESAARAKSDPEIYIKCYRCGEEINIKDYSKHLDQHKAARSEKILQILLGFRQLGSLKQNSGVFA